MKLGLREANQKFSKAVKAVRAGKDVVLTDRGRPIAIIKPINEHDIHDAALQSMIDEGLVRRAARKGPRHTRWRPVKVKGKPLSHTVIEDREDSA
jgi:prevent-host-death family protein